MSLRRSARLGNGMSVANPGDEAVARTTKRVMTTSISTESKKTKLMKPPTPKRIKQEKETGESPTKKGVGAPQHWRTVFERIREYRKVTEAPVDTMGCERMAEPHQPEKVQRFQTLVSLMLSAQTKDTVTSVAVRRLQRELPGGLTLESILQVDEQQLDEYIKAVGFHNKKAKYIKDTAVILRDKFNGDIPDTIEGLTSLPGVGPKMGYLALQCAWHKNVGIGVDIHVHRISNRLGWCNTAKKLPEDTRKSLESWLPKEHWREINPMLVGFGQVMCLPRGPLCNECPVNQYCPSAVISKTKVKKETLVKQEWQDQDQTAYENTVIKSEDVTGTKSVFAGGHDPSPDPEKAAKLDW